MEIRVLELPSTNNNNILAIDIPTPSMQRKIW